MCFIKITQRVLETMVDIGIRKLDATSYIEKECNDEQYLGFTIED